MVPIANGKQSQVAVVVNKFNQIIVDYPPFCCYDGEKLQLNDKNIPSKNFICPGCKKQYPVKQIRSGFVSAIKAIRTKHENYYFYETLRKQDLHSL